MYDCLLAAANRLQTLTHTEIEHNCRSLPVFTVCLNCLFLVLVCSTLIHVSASESAVTPLDQLMVACIGGYLLNFVFYLTTVWAEVVSTEPAVQQKAYARDVVVSVSRSIRYYFLLTSGVHWQAIWLEFSLVATVCMYCLWLCVICPPILGWAYSLR